MNAWITWPDGKLLATIVRRHAQALVEEQAILVCLFLALGIELQPLLGWPAYLIWAGLYLLVDGVRLWRARRALRLQPAEVPRRTYAWCVVETALAASVLGLGAWLFMPLLPAQDQMLLTIFMFVLPAANLPVCPSRYLALANALPILTATAVAWALEHGDQVPSVATLTLIYIIVLIVVAVDAERRLARSVEIRQERDRVLVALEERNRDVETAMGKAEAEALARARVLAAASHDLRQPLHALSIYSAILAGNPSAETLRDVGRNVDQIVRSLGSLVNGLLDLSQLNVGHYVPERKVFALEDVIEDVCKEYSSAVAAKGLRLYRELTPLRLYDDPVAIGRIARNLIDNAIKYTDRGWVRVGVVREEQRASLTVADSGRGVAADMHGRIFEEFYQVDNPGRDRSLGVGLGLTIVGRLCELLDARVAVDSTPGVGSTFAVCFGGLVLEPLPSFVAEDFVDRRAVLDRQIFLVDDDPDILRSMGALLATWGAKAHLARSPQELERLFRRIGKPDLLIADIRLGVPEDGVALVNRLRARYGFFPIIVLTGETASDALAEAKQHRYPVLIKPVVPERLRQTIGDALAESDPVAVGAPLG
jgi:signal transduction histidine kinase/ActR/RegA family two-component response regulator